MLPVLLGCRLGLDRYNIMFTVKQMVLHMLASLRMANKTSADRMLMSLSLRPLYQNT